jgi:TPR repeat protein
MKTLLAIVLLLAAAAVGQETKDLPGQSLNALRALAEKGGRSRPVQTAKRSKSMVCRHAVEASQCQLDLFDGFMYSQGQGAPQNFAEAARWFPVLACRLVLPNA